MIKIRFQNEHLFLCGVVQIHTPLRVNRYLLAYLFDQGEICNRNRLGVQNYKISFA